MKRILKSVKSLDKRSSVSTSETEKYDKETVENLIDSISLNSKSSELQSEEKSKLFDALSSFFARDGNDFKQDELFDEFELAKETGDEKAYSSLLESLHRSKLNFSQFSVEKNENSSKRLRIKFRGDSKPKDVVNTDNGPIKNISILRSSSLAEEVSELRKEVGFYKSMVHFNYSHLQSSFDALQQKNQDRDSYNRDKLSDLRAKVYSLFFDFYKKSEIEDAEAATKMELPQDAFVFIMYKPLGLAGFTAWMVFFIQTMSYVLAVWEDIRPPENNFARNPVMNIPLGAPRLVHAGQAIAILLTFLVNDGLWESSIQLLNGYNSDLRDAGIKYIWWLVSNILRFTEGLAATFVIFILIVISDDIVTLFKDFTAMTFISSLDDVVFVLAGMSVLGKTLKEATEAGDDIVVTRIDLVHTDARVNLKEIKYYIRTPLFVIFCLMSGIYTIWLLLGVIPQHQGDYLCQSIYIQLGDTANPKLPYFSGLYDIRKPTSLFSGHPSYNEVRKRNNSTSNMKILFCRGSSSWVFTIEDCKKGVWLKTEKVKNDVQYNLFKTTELWKATERPEGRKEAEEETEKNFLPMNEIFLNCVDTYQKVKLSETTVCNGIEIDERPQFAEFKGTKEWSTKFKVVTDLDSNIVTVYEHPAYYQDTANSYEFVIYTGYRWGMFSSLKNGREAHEVIEEPFHLYNKSDIKFDFFSDPVDWQKSHENDSPSSLKWYIASNKPEGQRAEVNSPVTSVFICSECDYIGNPCFYDGRCMTHKNKTCSCDSGSTGTLCQVPPTRNGKCDDYFNSIEYGFDGGDCCSYSCVSTEEHRCGTDSTGKFYIGYDKCGDLCIDRNRCDSKPADFFSRFFLIKPSYANIGDISQASLNSNGRIMAVIKSYSRAVEVYDNDAHEWRMRGTTVTNVENVIKDSIEIVSHDNVFPKNNKGSAPIYPTATLAVRKNGKVSTFDWLGSVWEETTGSLSNYNQGLYVKQVALRKSGTVLCILYDNGIFAVFRRDDIYSHWNETRRINFEGCKIFGIPSHAETYILANTESVRIYSASEEDNLAVRDFDLPIRDLTTSRNGDFVAVLIGKPFMKGYISLFDITSFDFKDAAINIRGIPYVDAKIAFFEVDLSIVVHLQGSREDEIGIFIFIWYGNRWIMQREERPATDVIMSENRQVFVFLSGPQDPNTFAVYHVDTVCSEGNDIVHFTMNLDYSESIAWEIIDTTSSESWNILESGGPYPLGSTSFQYTFCIPNEYFKQDSEKCLSLKVTDFELDGLSTSGSIGISHYGNMYMIIDKTTGYEDIVVISNSEACQQTSLEHAPWEKYSLQLHETCKMRECQWIPYGQEPKIYTGFPVKYYFGTLSQSSAHSLSSDGFILAVSSQDTVRSNRIGVRILKYNDKDLAWIQHGKNITVDEASEAFGWAKSLSADGSVIAIGDHYSSTDRTHSGKVYVYSYDKEHSNWHQRGSTINATVSSQFGYSVSISADGSIIAIASQPSNQNEECNVFVYSYDEKAKEWTIQGECINTLREISVQSTATQLSLSSNGRFLVIGVHDSGPLGLEYSGTVFCYKYSVSTNRWKRLGKEIQGDGKYHALGYCVSISADGSTIAMSGYNGYPAKVFEYSSNIEDWRQLGEDIPTTGPEGVVMSRLSSNGEILVLSMVTSWHINYYDKELDQWFHEFYSDFQESADLPGVLWIAMSADALTMAIENKSEESVLVSRLEEVKSSGCQQTQSLFNFTIIPDLFPEDIYWRVYGLDDVIAGSVLPRSAVGKLEYTLCLSKHTLYTLAIYDSNSDGICCDWGEGKFYVEYDEKPVMDSENIEKFEIEFACLSPIENADMSQLTIINFHHQNSTVKENEVRWSLGRGDEKIIDEKLLIDPRWFGICLDKKECWTFGSYHAEGKGVNYTINVGNQTYYNTENLYYVSKTKVGNCESEIIRTCPDGKKLFEFDLYTDVASSEIFWDFTGLNLTKISSKRTSQIVEYQGCVSPVKSGCATFVLLDLSGDSSSTYEVKFDSEHYDGKFSSSILKEYFGGDHCAKKLSCGENEGLFEIDFITHENALSSFSWEISDNQNNAILASGGNYTRNKYYYDATCLSLTRCMTFFRKDSRDDRTGSIFQIIWNKHLVINRHFGIFNSNNNTIQFGLCQNEAR